MLQVCRFAMCIMVSLMGVSYVNAQSNAMDKYVGEWSGYMVIAQGNTPMDTVPAAMSIAEVVKDSIWTWNTSYSGAYSVEKNYRLIKSNRPHEFILDEGDGITLMVYLTDQKLVSMFHYEDTHMYTAYELVSDELRFEIYITAYSKKRTVNGEIADYPLLSTQKSFFTRIN